MYPRSAGIFSFETGPLPDAPAEASLALLVSRAPMVATIVGFATPDLDANLQARIMREVNQSALLAVRDALSVSEVARLLS